MELLRIKAKKIKIFITDVDGVLTDGKIIYSNNGEEIKAFHVQDGLGFKLLKNIGIKTAIITSRKSNIVEKRGKELKIDYIFQNIKNKKEAVNIILQNEDIKYENILYIGDDLVDLPVLKKVGFPVTVPSAPEILKENCIYITKKEGGNGAVREVIDLILKLREEYEEAIKEFLE